MYKIYDDIELSNFLVELTKDEIRQYTSKGELFKEIPYTELSKIRLWVESDPLKKGLLSPLKRLRVFGCTLYDQQDLEKITWRVRVLETDCQKNTNINAMNYASLIKELHLNLEKQSIRVQFVTGKELIYMILKTLFFIPVFGITIFLFKPSLWLLFILLLSVLVLIIGLFQNHKIESYNPKNIPIDLLP